MVQAWLKQTDFTGTVEFADSFKAFSQAFAGVK
jgi:hypothetical protein